MGSSGCAPPPDLTRLLGVARNSPREFILQAKHFLAHHRTDPLTEARIYHRMCRVATAVLRQSTAAANAGAGAEWTAKGCIMAWMAVQHALARGWEAADTYAAGAQRVGEATAEPEVLCI